MKRAEKHLRYSAANRRPQLDEARYGSLIKLLILAVVLAFLGAAVILGSRELLRFLSSRRTNPATEVPDQPAVWSDSIRSLPDAGWVGEVSEWSGFLLYASGPSADSLPYLVRLNMTSGDAERVDVPLTNGSIRYPYENEDWILYGDYASDGSGVIRLISKETGSETELCSFREGAPKLFCSFPFLVFTARTATDTYTLTVFDIRNGISVAAACFSGTEYGTSDPSVRGNQLVYANTDPDHPEQSLIRRISLSDGSRSETVSGLFLHDPVLAENGAVLALSGLHSSTSSLVWIGTDGSVDTVAHSAVRYGICRDIPVYSANGTVFYVEADSARTAALSETGAVCELLGTTDSAVVWADRSDPEQPVYCYLILN